MQDAQKNLKNRKHNSNARACHLSGDSQPEEPTPFRGLATACPLNGSSARVYSENISESHYVKPSHKAADNYKHMHAHGDLESCNSWECVTFLIMSKLASLQTEHEKWCSVVQ